MICLQEFWREKTTKLANRLLRVVEFQIQLQKSFEPIVWLRLLLPLKMKEERNSLHFVYTTRKIVRARATQCFNLKNLNSSDKTQNIVLIFPFNSVLGCKRVYFSLWFEFDYDIFTDLKMTLKLERSISFHRAAERASQLKDLPFWIQWRYHD